MNTIIKRKIMAFILPALLISSVFAACHSGIAPDIPETKDNLPKDTLIKIYKKERVLKLYVDGNLIETFKTGLGSSPEGDKNVEGDRKTPTGTYYICTRNEQSRFTLFLGISYPNSSDAKRGLDSGIIDAATYESIKKAEDEKTRPPWKTALGGEVGIHGGGNAKDWTWGCIALSDDDIRILWQYAKLETPVEIFE